MLDFDVKQICDITDCRQCAESFFLSQHQNFLVTDTELHFPTIKKNEPEKTADISRRHHWFPREMTSENRVQKFRVDDVSLPKSG